MLRIALLVVVLFGFSAQSAAANNDVFEDLLKDFIIQKLEEELGVERPDPYPPRLPWYRGFRRLPPGPIGAHLVNENVPRALVGYCASGTASLPNCRQLVYDLQYLAGDCRVAIRIVDLDERERVPRHLDRQPRRAPYHYPIRMFAKDGGVLNEYWLSGYYSPWRVQRALGC